MLSGPDSQKIVAEDEAILQAAEKSAIDIQALPTRQYLDQTIVPILLQGMAAVARTRLVFASCSSRA